MNLLAGSTGFLGNAILKELASNKLPTIALTRRPVNDFPKLAQQMIIDFEKLSELELPFIENVYLSLGYPLYYHNVIGIMDKNLKNTIQLLLVHKSI